MQRLSASEANCIEDERGEPQVLNAYANPTRFSSNPDEYAKRLMSGEDGSSLAADVMRPPPPSSAGLSRRAT